MKTLRSVLPKYLLLHPEFRYTSALGTNVAKTFERFGFIPPSQNVKTEEKNADTEQRASHE